MYVPFLLVNNLWISCVYNTLNKMSCVINLGQLIQTFNSIATLLNFILGLELDHLTSLSN